MNVASRQLPRSTRLLAVLWGTSIHLDHDVDRCAGPFLEFYFSNCEKIYDLSPLTRIGAAAIVHIRIGEGVIHIHIERTRIGTIVQVATPAARKV